MKIVKRRWREREARVRKFGGVADKDSCRQLLNSVLFVIFILVASSMLGYQQQAYEAAELSDVATRTLQEILTFTPYKKYCVEENMESASTSSEPPPPQQAEQTAEGAADGYKDPYQKNCVGKFDLRLLPSSSWMNITEVGDIQDFIR